MLACNKGKFDRLPADVQKAMIEAARGTVQAQVMRAKEDDAKQVGDLKAKGVRPVLPGRIGFRHGGGCRDRVGADPGHGARGLSEEVRRRAHRRGLGDGADHPALDRDMVVYGVLTGTSIAKLFLAGVIPGVLIGLSLEPISIMILTGHLRARDPAVPPAPLRMTPMHALIVHAHPEPTSYTAALKDAASQALRVRGHEVSVSDLHAEGFNPVAGRHDFATVADPARFHYQAEQLHAARHDAFSPDLAREQARVARADLFVFTFPIWWGGLPAILKGWFDRVMAYGFAYADGKRFDQGYFRGRRALMGIATGGTAERFSRDGVYGEIDDVLYPVRRCMFEYLGLEVLPPFVAYGAARGDDAARRAYLEQWAQAVVAAVDDPAWQARMQAAPAIPALGTDDTGGWTARR